MSRRCFLLAGTALLIGFVTPLRWQSGPAWKDPSPHMIRFISVDDNVPLEVLDWGGSGRALVLLAGGGDTAHVFDGFAPKLTPTIMSMESRDEDSALPVTWRRLMWESGWEKTSWPCSMRSS